MDEVFGIPVTGANVALTLFALVVGQMVVSKNPIVVSIGKFLQGLFGKATPASDDVVPASPSDDAVSDAIYVLRTRMLDDIQGQKLVDALDSHWWSRRSGGNRIVARPAVEPATT